MMLNGDKLQDVAEQKYRAMLIHKQRINSERLERLHGGGRGELAAALDAQVAEKKQQSSDDVQYDLLMREQAMNVERVLAAAEEEEKEVMVYAKSEVVKSWENAVEYKKEKVEIEKRIKDIDLDLVGPAAAQKFQGAGDGYEMNERLKKTNQRAILLEQMAEKSESKAGTKEDDLCYAQMMQTIDGIREEAEIEEVELRKYVTNSVKEHNKELAASAKARRDKEIYNEKMGTNATFDILNEHKEYAYDSKGRIMRKDAFKGYTDAQQRRFLLENQLIIDEKHARNINQANADYEWSLAQDRNFKVMEQADYEEKCMREEISKAHTEFLKSQVQGKRDRAAALKKEADDTTDSASFYSKFGTTAR